MSESESESESPPKPKRFKIDDFEALQKQNKQLQIQNEQLRMLQRVMSTSYSALLDLEEIKLRCTGTDASHTNGNHQIATVEETIEYNLSLGQTDSIRRKLQENYWPSKLLATLIDPNTGTQKELRYYTKADVASFVADALFDAIGIADMSQVLKPHALSFARERSLFSVRPDILVIRSDGGIPLIIIKVKKPIG